MRLWLKSVPTYAAPLFPDIDRHPSPGDPFYRDYPLPERLPAKWKENPGSIDLPLRKDIRGAAQPGFFEGKITARPRDRPVPQTSPLSAQGSDLSLLLTPASEQAVAATRSLTGMILAVQLVSAI